MDEPSSRVTARVLPPSDSRLGLTPRGSTATLARTLLAGAGWSAFGQLLPVIFALILTPFLIRHLGLERYGIYVLCLTVIGYLRTFDGGLGATSVRYFAIYAGADRRAETTRLLTTLVALVGSLGLVVCVIVYFLAPSLLAAFGADITIRAEGIFLLRVFVIVAVASLVAGLFGAVLAARQRFALQSVVGAGSALAGFAATLASVGRGGGLRSLAIILAAQAGVSLVVVVLASMRWLDREAIGFITRTDLREFLKTASRIQIVSLGALLTLETDSLIVGLVKGPREVSLYSVGANFAAQLRQVVLNGLGPINTQLGRSFGERGQRALPEFEALQRVWVVGVTAWCAAGIGSAYVGITTWLGPGFETTGVIATVLAISNMINLWTGVTTAWLQTTGYAGIEARYSLVGIAVNVGLTGLLVAPLGLGGICIGTASGQIVATAYLSRLTRRGVSDPFRSFFRDVPYLSGAICLAVVVVAESATKDVLPRGVVGLLLSGLVTIPGLVIFGWRERHTFGALRTRRRS